MERINLNGEVYNLTQLAKRWKISQATCRRAIDKLGVDKCEAYYMNNEPLGGELYNYKYNVTLSDGKTYTLPYLAHIGNIHINSIYYIFNTSKDSLEFEAKYNKAVNRKSGIRYKLSNGTELSLEELEKLWGVSQHSIKRHIQKHGIKQSEIYYTNKLKKRYNKFEGHGV